jgi:hypothetical protein
MSDIVKFEPYNGKCNVGGHVALLGRWDVGRTEYDGLAKREEPKYIASCRLPGIKERLGNFATEDEAKERIVKAVTVWLAGAGLLKDEANAHLKRQAAE